MRQVKGKYQKWVSILVLLLMVALTSFMFVGCSGGGAEKKEGESGRELTPQEKAQETRVKDENNPSVLYTYNCGPCHGGDGSGIVGPRLQGISLTVEQIENQIENGSTKDGNVVMPAFKSTEKGGGASGQLSEDQIKLVANFVKNGLK